MSPLGVGTVLRLEKDAWSMVQRLRQATNEYAPPPPNHSIAVAEIVTLHRRFLPVGFNRVNPVSTDC